MTPTKDQRSISSIHFSFLLSKFQLYPPSSPFLRSLCLFAAKTPRFRKPRKTRNFTKPKTPTEVSAPYFQNPAQRLPLQSTRLRISLHPSASEILLFFAPLCDLCGSAVKSSSRFQLSAFQISALPTLFPFFAFSVPFCG